MQELLEALKRHGVSIVTQQAMDRWYAGVSVVGHQDRDVRHGSGATEFDAIVDAVAGLVRSGLQNAYAEIEAALSREW